MSVRINPPITLYGPSPSMGALLGTTASSEVLQEINGRHGATFFGSRYDAVDNAFMQNIIIPMRQTSDVLKQVSAVLVNTDQIVALTELESFISIPSSMHMPILLYKPVRELLHKGRIDGFGYDPENLPEEDIYERLLNNGTVNSLADAINRETQTVTFRWELNGSDPSLSAEDRNSIRDTREFIDYMLSTTDRDPTNIELMRG